MLKVKSKVWLLPAILFFSLNCSQKNQSSVVASVGDKKITLSEFRDMYQFNPSLAGIKSDVAAKRLLLQSLIAEKLLATAAVTHGLADQPKTKAWFEEFKREALIEKLWQDSIFSKIQISQNELLEAYRQSKQKRVVQYFLYDDSTQAALDYSRLRGAMTFTELARLKGFSLKTIPQDTILSDTRLPSIRPQVYRMKINEVSSPIKEGRYYFILKLTNILTNVFQSQDDFEQQQSKLAKTIRLRKSARKFAEYKQRHFKTAPYTLDKEIFKKMVRAMDSYLFSSGRVKPKGNRLGIDLEKNASLGNMAQEAVVHFNDGRVWTVKELLRRAEVAPYPIEFKARGEFRLSILAAVKHVLDDEALAQEALRLGLGKTAYVRNQRQMWSDYLLYELEKSKISQKKKTAAAKSKAFLRELSALVKQHDIHINHAILDTLSVSRANMFVFKTHFPERTIVPALKIMALPDSMGIFHKK